MFYINIKSLATMNIVQKIKDEILSFWAASRSDQRYILLKITSDYIRVYVIDNVLVEEEELFLNIDIEKILLFLKKFKDVPVFGIISDWETSVKHLNLKGANVFDRYFAQHHFLKCEFKKEELVYCLPSYNKDDIYCYYGVQKSPELNHVIDVLSTMKNGLIAFEQEEHILLNAIIQSSVSASANESGHIIFIKTEQTWKIIVGFGQDLIFCRHGVYEKNHDFMQEILQTAQYLLRLNFNTNIPITVYSETDTFSRIILAQNKIDLVECQDIESALYHYKSETLSQMCIKKIKNLNFMTQRVSFPQFFKHRFFYEFPRFSFSFLSTLLSLLTITLVVHTARYFYYDTHQEQIENLIKKNSSYWEKKNFFVDADQYLTFYQNNPVLLMKALSSVLPSYLVAEKVNFSSSKNTVSIRFKIIKQQNEDVIKSLKKTFENAFPKSKIDLKLDGKDSLSFEMEYNK